MVCVDKILVMIARSLNENAPYCDNECCKARLAPLLRVAVVAQELGDVEEGEEVMAC